MGEQPSSVDVVIVGAGFAGLYMLHSVRSLGLSAVVIEAGGDVGGTWYWNRYPGARCDVPSMEYSFGWDTELEQEWDWSERYASQPEILKYISHVAERHDLRGHIRFDTRVSAVHWSGADGEWRVETADGAATQARFVIMATGCLSAANLAEIRGRESFVGETYHTGHWPHGGVDFSGRRVAVIGTGASAVQAIPIIAGEASELTVFQRTPAYAVPAHNHEHDVVEVADIKARYPEWRATARATTTGFGGHIRNEAALVGAFDVHDEERTDTYEHRWEIGGLTFVGAFNDLLFSLEANDTAAEFVRGKIAEIVDDPDVAERLSPDTIIGCKRMCVDTNYYETYNQPHVSLVDISDSPISEITEAGIRVGSDHFDVDDIVFATGFDAMTGALDRIDIRGRQGLSLKDKWEAGPLTYLGLQVSGFPNLFTITGPGSPSVLTNMIVSIEQHVEWIADLLAHMEEEGVGEVEASADAEAQWVEHVNSVAGITLFHGCSSWYLGANVEGKARVFMPLPGFPDYKARCDAVAHAGYEGFEFSRTRRRP